MWFLTKWEWWVSFSWGRVATHRKMVSGCREWLFAKKSLVISGRVKSRWHRPGAGTGYLGWVDQYRYR